MTGQDLKNSILQLAIQGKLVPQDPHDEPASKLLERIKKVKEKRFKEGVIKKTKNDSINPSDCPYELPNNWVWVKVNDIAFVTKLAGFEYTKYIANNLKSSGVPLFKGKNVQNSSIVYEFEGYIDESLSDLLIRSQVNRKCLLTPYVGTIGNIAIHDKSGKFHLGSNVGKIEFFNDEENISIIEEYALTFLKSREGYLELTKYKKATAQESISIDAIREVYFPLPPLSEQQRIVAKIEELMPLVDEYDKAQNELDKINSALPEQLRQSILQEAIMGKLGTNNPDDEPASELLERIRKEKEKLIKEKKIKKEKTLPEITDEEKPFEIPENWVWCRIGDIFAHNNGKQLNKGNSHGQLMEYITTSNLYWDYFVLDSLKEMPFEETEFERCQAIKGDLLVCEGGDIGRACIWNYDYPIMLQNHIHKLRAYIPVETRYFYYIFYFYNKQGLIGGKGIGIQGFSSTALHNTSIPLPPLAEQHRIVEKLNALLPQISELNKQ